MAGIKGVDYIDENGNRVLTGGMLAKAKNLAKNPNYYQELGRTGGKVEGVKKGFAAMSPEKRRELGAKGGRISRKGKKND